MSRHVARNFCVGDTVRARDGTDTGEVTDIKFKNAKGNYSPTHVRVRWKDKKTTTWVRVQDVA